MPWIIVRVSPYRYSVINKKNGHVQSRSTTLEKAKRQIRLLNMIESKKV